MLSMHNHTKKKEIEDYTKLISGGEINFKKLS